MATQYYTNSYYGWLNRYFNHNQYDMTIVPTASPTASSQTASSPTASHDNVTDTSKIRQKNKIMKKMKILEDLFLFYVNLTGL